MKKTGFSLDNLADTALNDKMFQDALRSYQNKSFDAFSRFNQVISIDPNNSKAYFYRGDIYFKINNLRAAYLDYTKSIELKNNEPIVFYNRARVLFLTKNYQASYYDLTTCLQIDQKYYNAYLLRSEIFRIYKLYEKGFEDIDKIPVIKDCTCNLCSSVQLTKSALKFDQELNQYLIKRKYLIGY